jgi:serine/threonine protein kinase
MKREPEDSQTGPVTPVGNRTGGFAEKGLTEKFEVKPFIHQFQPGDRIGKYEIKSFLGRGGMGEVYRGFDSVIERDVALKVIPVALASDPTYLRRLIHEARAAGKLNHPNTVSLYEFGQDEETHFLVMEFLSGGNLGELVAKTGRLEWRRATRMIAEVCSGLAAAHAIGLLHRDIKPENILLTADERIKISDFGLAKAFGDLSLSTAVQSKPGELIGTPFYMSPEQFSGATVDHRSDLYSVGITYYQLLTGLRPFADSTSVMQVMYAHCHGPVPDPRSVFADVPAACAAVVARAMAKSAHDRYETAEKMADALLTLLTPDSGQRDGPIIVVEPSRMQAKILQAMLADLRMGTVRVIGTLADTVAVSREDPPSVVISAMHLDDGTGEELVNAVRSQPGCAAVQFVLMSSSAPISDAGPPQPNKPIVLAKPISKNALAQALRNLKKS